MTVRVLLVLSAVLAVFPGAPRASIHATFVSEVTRELPKTFGAPPGYFTWDTLARLPDPVRNHLFMSGFLDNPVMRNARIVWDAFDLKRKPEGRWTKLWAVQYNSVPEPARFVYMETFPWNPMAMAGRDKYQDGHGHMWIKAFGLFTAADEKSPEMDRSALVTVLAEALMVPSYALQPYIVWEARDSVSAKATLTWNGTRVSGIFHFNALGECIRFETRDRRQAGQETREIQWVATFEDYREGRGVRSPARIDAYWMEPGKKPFHYFRGRVRSLEFDRDSIP